jgi:hypothetical protein
VPFKGPPIPTSRGFVSDAILRCLAQIGLPCTRGLVFDRVGPGQRPGPTQSKSGSQPTATNPTDGFFLTLGLAEQSLEPNCESGSAQVIRRQCQVHQSVGNTKRPGLAPVLTLARHLHSTVAPTVFKAIARSQRRPKSETRQSGVGRQADPAWFHRL